MSTKRIFQASVRALPIMILAIFVVVGCSQSPLNSVDTVQPNLLQRSFDAQTALSPVGVLHAEDTISASEGGQLVLFDVVLDIPAGAVKNDTLFTIDIPDPAVFYNEFGTDGLVFDIPVTVTMSYRDADLSGVNESSIRIGWLNERTGAYQDVDCSIDFDAKTVTGKLSHFSAYALISD